MIRVALAGALWALAVFDILHPAPVLAPVMAVLLVGFVSLALPRTGRHTQALCGALAAATAGLAAAYGRWDAVPDGVARAAIFPAFLSTIVLLRAVADQRPEVAAARRMFAALDPARRDSGVVIGAHLLGAVLQVGVFAILAPILGRDASVRERREVFLVAMRGMALVPLWSPFVVGMALASQYLPAVPLWQIMSLGLSLAAASIAMSYLAFDRTRSLAALGSALRSLAPVAPPIAAAALIVVATTASTGLSTLQALVVALPVPCLLAALLVSASAAGRALKQTIRGLDRLGPEISILAFAMTLGMVFETSLPETGILDWLTRQELAPAAVVFIVVMTMNVAGLLGVHAVVTGTVLLVVFTGVPTGVSELVLMQALLAGWGLCTSISIGSLSIATGAAMFGLPPTRLVARINIVFVFAASTAIAGVLSALNDFLVG